MDSFGEYLRTLRLEQKLSPREAEQASGVSNSYLQLRKELGLAIGA